MAKNWWFKFEWNDWLSDEALLCCSFEAQGFWIRCLCHMHRSGTFELSGTVDDLRRLLGCLPEEVTRNARELKRTGAADVRFGNGDVSIKSRRLEREAKSKEKNRLYVANHRAKGECKVDVRQQSKSKSIDIREEEEKRAKFVPSPPRSEPPTPTASDFAPPENRPPKDSLFYHPAIHALRTTTKRCPPKEAWPLLAERIGSDVDLGKMTATVAEWVAAGHRATNFTGITDWYLGQRTQKTNGNGKPRPITAEAGKNPHSLEAEASCEKCHDTGEMIVPDPDGAFTGAIKWVACDCPAAALKKNSA